MLILLPNDPAGLDTLVASLNISVLSDVVRQVEARGDVRVQLPKFELESELDLQPLLIEVSTVPASQPATAQSRDGVPRRASLPFSGAIRAQPLLVGERAGPVGGGEVFEHPLGYVATRS